MRRCFHPGDTGLQPAVTPQHSHCGLGIAGCPSLGVAWGAGDSQKTTGGCH